MPTPPRVALIIETSVIYGRRILHGVGRYLRYHAPWSVYLEQHELGSRPPDWLLAGHWDGILSRPTDPALARQFQRMGVPVVDLNDLHAELGFPWVGSDHAAIGAMAAEHLRERGFRHFAFAGFSGEAWSQQRRAGFTAALQVHGFTPAIHEAPWRGPKARPWNEDLQELQTWLAAQPQPLGLMTCNDVRGLHVIDVAARAGILVPEEVAVVGVDNEEILCDLCNPPLSSVEPDAEQIGYLAAEILAGRLRGLTHRRPPRVLVPPRQVITRRSSESLAIRDRTVALAVRYIRDQAAVGCSVGDIVAAIRVPRATLERRFRQQLKRSPQAEIRAVQLQRVKELLIGTDYTLEHIAGQCGFEHAEYLSVTFKKQTGWTPGQYRRRHSRPGLARRESLPVT